MWELEQSTPKWVFGPNGNPTEVPADEPAYTYEPVTGEARGIVLEAGSTNLVRNSVDLLGAEWESENGTLSLAAGAGRVVSTPTGLPPMHHQAAMLVYLSRQQSPSTHIPNLTQHHST